MNQDYENLRAPEAADFLRLSPSKLAKWRMTGDGPPFARLGGVILYRKSELQRFIDERTNDGSN